MRLVSNRKEACSSGKLSHRKVVHAATSGAMLVSFGQVMAKRVVEQGGDLYLLGSSLPIYNRIADPDELRRMGGQPLAVPLENNLRPVNLIANTWRLWRLFRRLKPDIVHTRASVMGIVGRVAARLARVPIVVHHQDDLYFREASLSATKAWASKIIERALANRSDHTFVVTETIARSASRAGFDSGRITNVGHDISPAILAASKLAVNADVLNELWRRLGINRENFVVGAITRLERHKGLDTLIEVAARVLREQPEVKFVIRGRGPQREALSAMIDDFGLSYSVFLIDERFSDEELVAFYDRLDLFALPTQREGFGMVFAEAMLLGAVPVAPDIEPVNEVVTEGTGLLVQPTVAAFAAAILWAIKNPDELAMMRKSARGSASTRWGGTAAADRVIARYQNLLGDRT